MSISFDAGGFPKTIRAMVKRRLEQAMKEVMMHAVQNYETFTASRGTENSGHSGRVLTGEMLDAVDWDVYWRGVDEIVGEFGFLNRTELYFELQTITGFTHWLSGEFIEPTYALRDAQLIAVQELMEKLK